MPAPPIRFTKSLEVGIYVVSEYQHLSLANNLPSYVAKLEWRASDHLTIFQNLYYGPDQKAESLKYWRTFSDSTIEWRKADWRVALSYDVGTEAMAEIKNDPRSTWMGAALFTQLHVAGPWSVGVRPEFYWDPQGRMTQHKQLLWAHTTTLEYKKHLGAYSLTARLEHRYDHSTGSQAGFFENGFRTPATQRRASDQHLAILGFIVAFDSI